MEENNLPWKVFNVSETGMFWWGRIPVCTFILKKNRFFSGFKVLEDCINTLCCSALV
jgi:hypothetical protein